MGRRCQAGQVAVFGQVAAQFRPGVLQATLVGGCGMVVELDHVQRRVGGLARCLDGTAPLRAQDAGFQIDGMGTFRGCLGCVAEVLGADTDSQGDGHHNRCYT